MERINLTKYGFIRSPEDDFTDDGNKFTCYRVGKVRVSKSISNWDGGLHTYIAGRIDSDALPYEVYSQLPHYEAMDRLNGVIKAGITEEDLQQLYEDCLSYAYEWDEAVKSIKYPTVEELKTRMKEVRLHYQEQLAEVKGFLSVCAFDILTKGSEYKIKRLREHLSTIERRANADYCNEEDLEKWSHTANAVRFASDKCDALREHYWRDSILEILKEIGCQV